MYEADPRPHLGGASYIPYADQSRFACLHAAGVSVEDLLASGLGPVNLETVRHVSGLLDLTERRLIPGPAAAWRARAARPGLLGLPAG